VESIPWFDLEVNVEERYVRVKYIEGQIGAVEEFNS